MKKFISGLLLGAILFGTVSFAAGYEAVLPTFKVFVDGNEFHSDPPVLVVQDRTYLPLKAIGDALGVPVNWNSELSQVEVGNPPTAVSPIPSDSDNKVAVGLTVKEYTYSSYYHYAILVIKNTTDSVLKINGSVLFYDKDGNTIGADNKNEKAVGPNQEIVLKLGNDSSFDHISYTITSAPDTSYSEVVSSLSYTLNTTPSKAIIAVTNNGSLDAKYVEGTALFFNDGKLVDASSTYFINNNNVLQAGQTVTKEITCSETFDSVQFYLRGYGK